MTLYMRDDDGSIHHNRGCASMPFGAKPCNCGADVVKARYGVVVDNEAEELAQDLGIDMSPLLHAAEDVKREIPRAEVLVRRWGFSIGVAVRLDGRAFQDALDLENLQTMPTEMRQRWIVRLADAVRGFSRRYNIPEEQP